MGKTLADLQSNISISATNAVTGDIEWCSGYTQFSTDIGEQAGWYLALQVTPDVEDATVTAAYNGTIRELDNNIYIIRLADGEDTITFTAEKEGYTTGRLTLDLSGLNKETITNYCYVTSLTNGVTVTPLQFGESKILSGVVPYDTTTSSNHFTLKYRTFIPIPAGSEISVSHFGTELGASTFSTVTPQEGEPYSEATVDITITQDILDSQSPGLSTLIIPDTGEVLDRFYCSLGVENLTLEAPDVSYLLNTEVAVGGNGSGYAAWYITTPVLNRDLSTFFSGAVGLSPTFSNFTNYTKSVSAAGTALYSINLPQPYTDGYYIPIKIKLPNNENTPSTMKVDFTYNNNTYSIDLNNTYTVYGTVIALYLLKLSAITSFPLVFEIYDTRDVSKKIIYTLNYTNFKYYGVNSLYAITLPSPGTQYGNKTIEDIQTNMQFGYFKNNNVYFTSQMGPCSLSTANPKDELGTLYFEEDPIVAPQATLKYVSGWTYNNINYNNGNYLILRVLKYDANVPIMISIGNTTDWVTYSDTTQNYVDIIIDISTLTDNYSYFYIKSGDTVGSLNIQQGFNLRNVQIEPYIAPAANFVNNGSVITLNNTDALYKDAASTGTDTFQAGQYITNSTTNSSGSSYSGTSSAPYTVNVTANPVATDTWTAGFVITGGTNGNTPVLETGTTGTLTDWSVKMASDNKTITITYHGTVTTYASAKVYYSTTSGGTKHVLLTINPVT